MNNSETIYICHNPNTTGGGVETYVDSLLSYRISNVANHVIVPNKNVDQSQFKLLHINEHWMLNELRGECPIVYSLHNHDPYCPSGTKYLTAREHCCNRNISTLGCAWGRLVEGCGSRRPQRVIKDIQTSYQYLDVLKRLRIPVIANSDFVRKQLIRNGIAPEQVLTLRYGIEAAQSPIEPLTKEIHKGQRILFIGRLVPDKGLDWLLKALRRTSPQIHLDIAGEGWAKPQLQKLSEELGVSDRVTWHGWCSGDKRDFLFSQCFALIFPSLWPEPAGIVTLEAYARYRTVIASRVGGIPEHIHPGETGILVSPSSIVELASAIDEIADSYQNSKNLGEQGYNLFLDKFTIDHHIHKLQRIYEQVIENFYSDRRGKIVDFS